jgi:hypothetical protein
MDRAWLVEEDEMPFSPQNEDRIRAKLSAPSKRQLLLLAV